MKQRTLANHAILIFRLYVRLSPAQKQPRFVRAPRLYPPGNGKSFTVYKGAGDGTFNAGTSYALPANLSLAEVPAQILDANRDGRPDVVVSPWDRAYVLLGNGGGTSRTAETLQKPLRYVAGIKKQAIRNFNVMTGDFNRDGILDFGVDP